MAQFFRYDNDMFTLKAAKRAQESSKPMFVYHVLATSLETI